MQKVSGELWLGDRKPVRAIISIKMHEKKRCVGLLLASTGVRFGEDYLFKADDGRIGKFRVFLISPPGIADFVFESPFEM